MNNAKLTVSDMKDMIELFIKHKLQALKIGDFEIQKNYYDSESDNKAFNQEDPLFFSAPQLPPEMEELIASMQPKSKV